VVLGAALARDEDPYVLPGVWLDIDAESEGDGFVVTVQTDALPIAEGVLERARRFAAQLRILPSATRLSDAQGERAP
jgi:hypothetical protein